MEIKQIYYTRTLPHKSNMQIIIEWKLYIGEYS